METTDILDPIVSDLITNKSDTNMYKELDDSLLNCKSFIFSVAFISFGGLQLLLRSFDKLRNSQIRGRILTSDYQNFTDPKALRKIFEFKNIDTKIYLQDHFGGFHTKAYLFEFEDYYKIYIGSSNITESALIKNVEWNIRIISKQDNQFITSVIQEFNTLWDKTEMITERFLDEYEAFIQTLREAHLNEEKFIYHEKIITPNKMQALAIRNLHSLRTRGEDRALVIAATATGKTYMSAFDVAQFNPKRMLFIVHREDILDKAIESYKHVLGPLIDTGKFTGRDKNRSAQYLFATTQSLLRHYTEFRSDEFEYIVVDETHHAMADGNQSILNHFKPKFLLGMTATPERSDGFSLFSFYHNNVALEVRLFDAIEQELVSPFHYFGVTELEGINLSDIDENDIDTITQRLSINTRVKYIIEQLNLFNHDGKKLKCLGFCAGIEHALYMETKFNENGIPSKAIWGEIDVPTREFYVKRLEDENDELRVLFVVDVFNEGIDIPSINTVLMLRPTNSPIIFIQQLGRGLRKLAQKKFLTVIDFIGNYKKSFLIAVALKGARYYDKDSIKVAVVNDFSEIPGDTFIQIDEIAKEQILAQLDNENFNKLKYLKDEYFTFKRLMGNKTPNLLMDYLYFEGSPDPLKFIHYSKSYIDFLAIMEKSEEYSSLSLTNLFINTLRQLSSYLPLRRPIEFIILKHLIIEGKWIDSLMNNEFNNYVPKIDLKTIQFSLKNLSGQFLDKAQKSKFVPLLSDSPEISLSKDMNILIKTVKYKDYLLDVLNYGLARYQNEFSNSEVGYPFFSLYQTYDMTDAALLSNYEKTHSSFRGSGLLTHGKEYFLFVDLVKNEEIKESIKYHDRIIDTKTFQWQTPNSTSQSSERGKNIIENSERNINLHIFVRKFKKVDGITQPYIYLGKANSYEFYGNKPITVMMKFENELPFPLFVELTKIVISKKS